MPRNYPSPNEQYTSTYTPTVTAVANVDAVTAIYETHYKRDGDWARVIGQVQLDVTAVSVETAINISLPIPSDLVSENCVGYIACKVAGFTSTGGLIQSHVANNEAYATFIPSDTGGRVYSFTFDYTIL